MKALIVVDFQKDYCKKGAKEIKGSNHMIKHINKYIKTNHYDIVIFTKDWFPDDHTLFINHKKYCVENTIGSEFPNKLNININNIFIFKKGLNPDIKTYSCFYENDHKTSTGLMEFLKEKNVDVIDICGLKTNTTIKNTAIDSIKNGFKTNIILNLCIDKKNDLNIEELKVLNIKIKII